MLLLDKQPTGNPSGVATRSWGLDADASPTQQAGFPTAANTLSGLLGNPTSPLATKSRYQLPRS